MVEVWAGFDPRPGAEGWVKGRCWSCLYSLPTEESALRFVESFRQGCMQAMSGHGDKVDGNNCLLESVDRGIGLVLAQWSLLEASRWCRFGEGVGGRLVPRGVFSSRNWPSSKSSCCKALRGGESIRCGFGIRLYLEAWELCDWIGSVSPPINIPLLVSNRPSRCSSA